MNLRRVENYFIVRVGIGSCRSTRRRAYCRVYRRAYLRATCQRATTRRGEEVVEQEAVGFVVVGGYERFVVADKEGVALDELELIGSVVDYEGL